MEPLFVLIAFVVGLPVYFAPAIVAGFREHPHAAPIFILNLFGGWIGLGWIAALVWASMPVHRQPPPEPPRPIAARERRHAERFDARLRRFAETRGDRPWPGD